VIDRAMRRASEELGNTPAVARRAYIDPRVFARYRSGGTIARALPTDAKIGPRDRARLERAVINLLTDEHKSTAMAICVAATEIQWIDTLRTSARERLGHLARSSANATVCK